MEDENQYIEFKESWRDEYMKTLSAFANKNGGKLFIGINDEGCVVGVEKSKKLLEDLPNKIINSLGITASIMQIEKEGKFIIEISVSQSPTPIAYQSKFYVRSGSTTQELRGSELQQYILKASKFTWDAITVPEASFEDIDLSIVHLFIKKAIECRRLIDDKSTWDIHLLFRNLELISSDNELTRAALLLFGKRPKKYFHSAEFKIGRFKSDSFTNLVSQDLLEENIFQMPDKVMELLQAKYLMSPITYRKIQRIETLEIPEKAIREAILNAIIHRDYSSVSSIHLAIFDNSITLWNPGTLAEPLKLEMLKNVHPSIPRNKIMANIFYRAGFIESWGRGTITIIEEMKNSGLPEPIFENHVGGVKVIFIRNPFRVMETSQYIRTKYVLNLRQKAALEYLNENKVLTNSKYQELNNISKPTATRDLKDLVEKKLIENIGKRGAGTNYVLIGS